MDGLAPGTRKRQPTSGDVKHKDEGVGWDRRAGRKKNAGSIRLVNILSSRSGIKVSRGQFHLEEEVLL